MTAGVSFTIETAKSVANLARREADIALRMRRLPPEGDIVRRRLGRVGFSVYGSRAWANDAAACPVIGLPDPERRPSQASFLEDWAGSRPIPARFADLALRYRAVADGHGASLLPCWLGDRDDALVRFAAPPRDLREDAYLLVRADSRKSPAVDTLVRSLAALFKTHAGALAGADAVSAGGAARSS